MNDINFWNDKEKADEVIKEASNIKSTIEKITIIKNNLDTNIETLEILKDEEDPEILELLTKDLDKLTKDIELLKIETYLNGKYDSCNCILEIHSGAGGTEACDWAEMLYRMYSRYLSRNNYILDVLDTQYGEEVGIKSI